MRLSPQNRSTKFRTRWTSPSNHSRSRCWHSDLLIASVNIILGFGGAPCTSESAELPVVAEKITIVKEQRKETHASQMCSCTGEYSQNLDLNRKPGTMKGNQAIGMRLKLVYAPQLITHKGKLLDQSFWLLLIMKTLVPTAKKSTIELRKEGIHIWKIGQWYKAIWDRD